MGIFSKKTAQVQADTVTRLMLVREEGKGFYSWNGNVYQSDIVRSCIRPKVKAIGKLVGKHIRETLLEDGTKKIEVNPDAYLRFLLEEPNPLMSGQKLQEKLAAQLCLNNNAFALIMRDGNGIPMEIYPLDAVSAQAKYRKDGSLLLCFQLKNGKTYNFLYADIIHLRQDYCDDELFGNPVMQALAPLMEIVTTTDQGIVKAIKNSNIIRWLLRFTTSQRDEDIKKRAAEFAKSFLDTEGEGVGVAAVDTKAEAKQIDPKDYVPNAAQMDRTVKRIQALFNTNDKIVHSSCDEEEWNSYFEAEIEPAMLDFDYEYTRKIFTRRARGFGNKILFEAANLQYASITTKLALVSMVDRMALTPNEWRATLHLAPLPGGDKPLRRLDTTLEGKRKIKLNGGKGNANANRD